MRHAIVFALLASVVSPFGILQSQTRTNLVRVEADDEAYWWYSQFKPDTVLWRITGKSGAFEVRAKRDSSRLAGISPQFLIYWNNKLVASGFSPKDDNVSLTPTTYRYFPGSPSVIAILTYTGGAGGANISFATKLYAFDETANGPADGKTWTILPPWENPGPRIISDSIWVTRPAPRQFILHSAYNGDDLIYNNGLFWNAPRTVAAQLETPHARKPPAPSATTNQPWIGRFEGVSNMKFRHVLVVDQGSIAWTEQGAGGSTGCVIAANAVAAAPTIRNARWSCQGAQPSTSHSLAFDSNQRAWQLTDGTGSLVERVTLRPAGASSVRAAKTTPSNGCSQVDAERALLATAQTRTNPAAQLGRSTEWKVAGPCSWFVNGVVGWRDPMGTPMMFKFAAAVGRNSDGSYVVDSYLVTGSYP